MASMNPLWPSTAVKAGPSMVTSIDHMWWVCFGFNQQSRIMVICVVWVTVTLDPHIPCIHILYIELLSYRKYDM